MTASLDTWLEKISEVHPVGWDLGLERVGTVARRLDVLQPADKVVLVAGTNGKGSTCEFLTEILLGAGLHVGKSTSPHLLRFNERICIDRQNADDSKIVEAFEEIDRARAEISLTYFEFSTLASLYLFKQAAVDVAVLEIGLGGRLDAMNIVTPDVSIITSISLDHEAWLGNSREEIGREKAGILRAGVPCVLADLDPPASVLAEINRLNAPLSRVTKADLPPKSLGLSLPPLSFVAASMAATLLGVYPDNESLNRVARETHLPGRRTWLQWKCRVLLDVAHNPAAAEQLAKYLEEDLQAARLHVISGMYADKDIDAVYGALKPLVSSWHLVDLAEERAASATSLAGHLEHVGQVSTYATIDLAADALASEVDAEDVVVVTGSFPVVAAGLQCFG